MAEFLAKIEAVNIETPILIDFRRNKIPKEEVRIPLSAMKTLLVKGFRNLTLAKLRRYYRISQRFDEVFDGEIT